MANPASRFILELKADPALIDAMNALARSLSGLGLQVVNPVSAPEAPATTGSAPATSPAPTSGTVTGRTTVAKPPAEVPKAAPEQPTQQDAQDAARSFAEAKGRDALVELLATFGGAASSKAIKPELRADFIAAVRAGLGS